MATVDKPAGSGGTYTYTLTAAPAAPPTRTIFTDAARTVIAAAAQVMTAAGTPVQFTGTYPLTLAAGRYFLRHTFSTAGGAALVDDDDELLLVNPNGTVGGMYAIPQDVADLFRPLTDRETVKASRLLEFASSIVRDRTIRLDERIAAGTLDPDLVAGVVTAMVVRVMRNPDGRRVQTETAGPFTESWTVDQALSSGALYVSDAELGSLAPPAARLRVGTIRLRSWC